MNLSLFTSFEGRIGRQSWWLGLIALAVIEWVGLLLLAILFGVPFYRHVEHGMDMAFLLAMRPNILFGILSLLFLWPALAIYTKRWHDRDKSGWWTLIGLVPMIGGIWLLVEPGFLRGTDGPNRFGPDPLRR